MTPEKVMSQLAEDQRVFFTFVMYDRVPDRMCESENGCEHPWKSICECMGRHIRAARRVSCGRTITQKAFWRQPFQPRARGV
jgi:hypothetical protein